MMLLSFFLLKKENQFNSPKLLSNQKGIFCGFLSEKINDAN